MKAELLSTESKSNDIPEITTGRIFQAAFSVASRVNKKASMLNADGTIAGGYELWTELAMSDPGQDGGSS
jgi:hypothetical protein